MSTATIFAYLDPGTGSLILQMVVGGILGGLLAIKLFWRRILGLFTGKKPASEAPAATDDSVKADAETK